MRADVNDGILARPSYLVATLLLIHAALLAWSAARQSPSSGEAGHMAAGVATWRLGRFDLYCVNPPLARIQAAIPAVLCNPNTDWTHYDTRPPERPEWAVGSDFIHANARQDVFLFFTLGRWALIPTSVLGGYTCWLWAGRLYGRRGGFLALALWCFSPNVIAWGAAITPDASAAALGVTAGYCFWRWLGSPTWFRTALAGASLGVLLLTKTTWIILAAIWPALWLIHSISTRLHREHLAVQRNPPSVVQLICVVLIGLYVVNVGFGFEGSFQSLRDYTFVSRTLAGDDSVTEGGRGGNRFQGSWVGWLPVPIPKNYVVGIDLQKLDFEQGLPSYLFGRWSEHGWWYYYLVCGLLKSPVGVWLLGIIAASLSIWRIRHSGRAAIDELVLLLPAIVLFVLVSSQTGVNRHFRYVLPALPFLFIWTGKVACITRFPRRIVGHVVLAALTWFATSSLWIYPHSLSYFNEVAGGPRRGHRYLLHSNLDSGQDVFYMRQWCHQNPQAQSLRALFRTPYSAHLSGPGSLGLPPRGPTIRDESAGNQTAPWQLGPRPGWYACSVQAIYRENSAYAYFRHFSPTALVGYSLRVYHISWNEATRVRRQLGMPPLADVSQHVSADSWLTPNSAAGTSRVQRPLRVAVFAEQGPSKVPAELTRILDSEPSWTWELLDSEAIRDGSLDHVDTIIFPGGGGSRHAAALGPDGSTAVREYVQSGGGYLGICAGTFLASSDYGWSLALINVRTMTGERTIPGVGVQSLARRGSGTVTLELTDAGARIFDDYPRAVDVLYAGGPILLPADREDLPEYLTLAVYRTEIWRHELQRGTMIDTPAIVAAAFGQGRVVAFSPHAEMTEGLQSMVKRAIHLVARAGPDVKKSGPE